ncbi:MAG: acyl-CoA synthetase FdrA [bacterium]
MTVKGIVRKGEYFDSVALMNVAKKLNGLPGVEDSAAVMGTRENKSILEASGLLLPDFKISADADLIIAVRAKDETTASGALEKAALFLKKTGQQTPSGAVEFRPGSLAGALKVMPDADMALISVAGRYAGDVAMEALKKNLHVMLFSDNVPIETEIVLKKFARKKGLLVMGPDCGTAIINGVPLAFANSVRKGSIGIVAAAGTGLQETSCIISNYGAGISQAIGTGGRDVRKEVGGMTFLQALEALSEDRATKVILLVSKPPHPEVFGKILDMAKKIKKPVVSAFLGADSGVLSKAGIHACSFLDEAALTAVALAAGKNAGKTAEILKIQDLQISKFAADEAGRKADGQKYLRGLFSGGTFVSEAQLVMKPVIGDVWSNVPLRPGLRLKNSLKSTGNTVVDLGEDEFTVGRPHPMIDYSLKNRRIAQEAKDPETAVMLLDIVIGYGSNMNPLAEITPAIKEARQTAEKEKRHISIVCSVTGTDSDPQCRGTVVKGLEDAGCIVMPANAGACRLAGRIVCLLKKKALIR